MTYFRFIIAILFLAVSGEVSAQTFVESQNVIKQEGVTAIIDAQIQVPAGKVNAYGWFLVTEGWGEGLVGVSKSLKPWLWVSAAVGVDTKSKLRMSNGISVGKGRVSVFGTVEYGDSGVWYKSVGLVRLSRRVKLGYHTQKSYGTGPMAQISITPTLSVWGSTALGERKSLIGIKKFL